MIFMGVYRMQKEKKNKNKDCFLGKFYESAKFHPFIRCKFMRIVRKLYELSNLKCFNETYLPDRNKVNVVEKLILSINKSVCEYF